MRLSTEPAFPCCLPQAAVAEGSWQVSSGDTQGAEKPVHSARPGDAVTYAPGCPGGPGPDFSQITPAPSCCPQPSSVSPGSTFVKIEDSGSVSGCQPKTETKRQNGPHFPSREIGESKPCSKGSTQSPDPPPHGEVGVTAQHFPSLPHSGPCRWGWPWLHVPPQNLRDPSAELRHLQWGQMLAE